MLSWFLCSALLSAAPGSMSIADREAVVAALERDREQLADWQWELDTAVRLEGHPEFIKHERARLGESGEIERSPSPGSPEPRRMKGPKRLGETVAALERIADAYSCPDPGELEAALSRAHAWASEDGRVLHIQSRDVLRRGDSMEFWVDRSDMRLLGCSILSSYEGEPIKVEVRYSNGDEGPWMPVEVELTTELGERVLILHATASAPIRG